MTSVLERYNEHQLRDPGGDGGGQWMKAEPFDMSGFDLIAAVEGTFGDVEFGVSDVGDIRMAFREGGQNRVLDLGDTDLADLRTALDAVAGERDRYGTAGDSDDLVDEHWFGGDEEHKVALWANGLVEVVFGAEEDDPWTLQLDPPYDDEDDVEALLDAIDTTLDEVDAADGEGRTVRAAFVERKYNPKQLRDPGGEDGGQWVKGPVSGAGSVAIASGQAALDAAPARLVGSGYPPGHHLHKPGRLQLSSAAPEWSPGEREARVAALEAYQSEDFRAINRSLRHMLNNDRYLADYASLHRLDPADARGHLAEQVRLIDDVMDASKLTEDIRVTRGTETGRGVFGHRLGSDLTGYEWTEDAYVSTSADPEVAEYFTRSGLSMEIVVPAGTGAVNLSGFTSSTGGADEAEILLERGLRMRVVGDTGPGDPRTLRVEVLHG